LKNSVPSIKTHLGLWGEVVELNALEKVATLTLSKIYHEHVTNFIYGNKNIFNVNLIKAPSLFYDRTDIRLTVDENEDFLLMRKIYSELMKKQYFFHLEDVVNIIDNNPDYLKIMRSQIEKNKK
jgi:spore coat polysaccharide biosynthesis protein SpsF